MRWPVALLFGLALVGGSAGCRSCHRVEAELRSREDEVYHLKEELERNELYNQALQQEVQALRGHTSLVPGPGGTLTPPAAYPVRSLTLGRSTGGTASDRCPGDDALAVLATPLDPEGQAIKAPGTLIIQAVEINKQGLKQPLSSWDIPPAKLRETWKSGGLFSSGGYNLTLPWKVWPSTNRLRVVATLRLTDGRVFEAEKDVTIRVTPLDKRPPLPGEKTEPLPATPVLPAPRPLDPSQAGPALDQASWNAPRGPLAPTVSPVWRREEPPAVPDVELLRPAPSQQP